MGKNLKVPEAYTEDSAWTVAGGCNPGATGGNPWAFPI
jgi:hypothetical protein